MEGFVVIFLVAFLSSALTFYSGFGLGTLLLPAFALFFPVEHAVAMTAIVHFLNGLFKVKLIGKHADWNIVIRFGTPAILASFLGAYTLMQLVDFAPIYSYSMVDKLFSITPIKLTIGIFLLIFVLIEFIPSLAERTFPPEYMPVGGILSGFFGGLAGMQGALRTAFLSRAGLTKEVFVGTGAMIACLIDLTRLIFYGSSKNLTEFAANYFILFVGVLGAFLGAAFGNQYLKKVSMPGIQRVVGLALFVVAIGLISGVL